ncbi:MAG: hypothetical protein CMO74_04575 [Verrucomicrobiales bacterium]|nr:hypothetical protein [Verrucomicrobiales bacterium]
MWSPRVERPFTLWRHIRRERRRIREAENPVVVYSHPKTASRAIEAAIAGLPSVQPFHAHVLQERHFLKGDFRGIPPNERGITPDGQPVQWAIRREIVESGRPLRLVSLVRDPVAVCVSWFFFGLQRWLACEQKPDPAKLDFEELLDHFHNRFSHDGMIHWFDDEWNKTTGLNIYSKLFDKSRGWQIYERGNIKAVILSAHLEDEIKANALSEFLDEKIDEVPRVNESGAQGAPEVYGKLQRSVRDNQELVDRLLNARFTRHFFEESQIDSFRHRWNDPD